MAVTSFRITSTVTIALGLLGSAGAAVAETASATSSGNVKLNIVQHNTDNIRDRWAALVAKARSGKHDAVAGQEVCLAWVKKLRENEPGWTVAYHQQREGFNDGKKPDCPGKRKGNVVIYPGKGTASNVAFDLPGEDPKKTFGVACVSFQKAPHKVHVCSTHFATYGDNSAEIRRQQAGRVLEITDAWRRNGDAVVIAGDLNALPQSDEMGLLYARFNEAAQLASGDPARRGPATIGGKKGPRKIDYIFFSKNHSPLARDGKLWHEHPGGPERHHLLVAKNYSGG